ncbi:MAG TPA: hypothetical protein VH165_02490 [Kofleriaceae bacterium]|jgi:hypothetical protein|nr:hypothetical protein [Kofleriaceae bacterium]
MSHLENIATRQRKSLVRDTIFVALLALASIVSASTVGQAVKASAPNGPVHTAPVAAR